ncbi:hypothetical protein TWF506_007206 [Arthrobotrys conoides]|uniref:Uncharacterized protein n=1 Tax=Arthrobotrys conoides TaxID=74498 RepID=A0AAN8RN28_9PEZI
MNSKAGVNKLPTELHTQIVEYLFDDFVCQVISGSILPIWGDILRETAALQRTRYLRFQPAWQNAVAIHRLVGETSGRFAICCAVRDRVIEKCSMAYDLQRSSERPREGGMLSSMGDTSDSWTEIDITENFVLDEHFLLPFRGTLAQDLKLPGEDVSVPKSHVDSDLRTSFLNVRVKQFLPRRSGSTGVHKLKIFPSHLEDMTLGSLLKFIIRKVDKVFQGTGVDIGKLHYFKLWPHSRHSDVEVEVLVYIS